MPQHTEQFATTASGDGWANFSGEPATSPIGGDGIEFPVVDFTGMTLADIPQGSLVTSVVARLSLYAGPDSTRIESINLTKDGSVVGPTIDYQNSLEGTTETISFDFTGLSLSYQMLQGSEFGIRVQFKAPVGANTESTVRVEAASIIASY